MGKEAPSRGGGSQSITVDVGRHSGERQGGGAAVTCTRSGHLGGNTVVVTHNRHQGGARLGLG